MNLTLNSTVRLRGGLNMPLFGLGTFLTQEGDCKNVVKAALLNGYRLIDTAAMYENEKEVGEGIRESGVPRDEIFIVTKLTTTGHGSKENVMNGLKKSLEELKIPHVDLYLIHSPKGGSIIETWKGMLACKEAGLCKAIGVSNFGSKHIQALKAEFKEDALMPEVNQIELHPWKQHREESKVFKEHGVQVMGFCPLARCKMFGTEGPVKEVAAELSVSEADVALRWAVQRGIVTIPKTSKESRLMENARAVSLSDSGSPLFHINDPQMDRILSADNTCQASMIMEWMQKDWDLVK